jgi:tRNA(Ile)-lysidine synthase
VAAIEISSHIERLVHECVQQDRDWQRLHRIVVGFSGGADSTALLAATVRAAKQYFPELPVQALHVNHGLHDAADTWQAHCRAVCAQLAVAFAAVAVTVPSSGNLEANARLMRYRAFAAHVDAGTLLLLGHHEHDQTETILYRLFQGRGLLPMRARGEVGAGRFARPLLSVAPHDLQRYLGELGLTWIEDDTNLDKRFARNFLRAEVVPRLGRHWQRLHQAVARVVGAQAAVQVALEHEVARLGNCVPITHLPDNADVRLAWLRAYLHSRGVYGVSDRALQAFDRQVRDGDHAQLQCGDGARLYLYDQHLHFVAAAVDESRGPVCIAAGERLQLPGGQLSLWPAERDQPGCFQCAQPLRIGYRRGGERITFEGFSKSLKQLFNEARVPPWQRGAYPLLYLDDELVCVPDLAVAARVAPGPAGTREPLCVAHWQANQ